MDATKHMIYCLLLLASNSYYSPVVVHAREIKFFHIEPTGTPEYAPAPAPGPATTAPGVVFENYGYGLYGSDSDSNSNTVAPQKEQIMTNNDRYETTRSSSDNNNNNNIDDEEEEEMLLSKELVNDETTSLEKDESAETYNNNNGNGYFDKRSVSNYYNGAYDQGQAGMSDTRYMESGKHFYDIKSDDAHDLTNSGSNNNGYTSTTTTTSDHDDETLDPQVYGTSSGYNAFNTVEEEYYQSQAYHNTKEQEYVP